MFCFISLHDYVRYGNSVDNQYSIIMKYAFLILFSSFIFFTTSCKDDQIDINMAEITERNEMGEIIGTTDVTDWRLDDKWTKEEEKLFSVTSGVYNKSANDSVIVIIPSKFSILAYPNPFTWSMNINFGFDNCSVRVIDTNKKVILAYDNVKSLLRIEDIPNTDKTQNYRVYYKIYTKAGILRGHGDLKQK